VLPGLLTRSPLDWETVDSTFSSCLDVRRDRVQLDWAKLDREERCGEGERHNKMEHGQNESNCWTRNGVGLRDSVRGYSEGVSLKKREIPLVYAWAGTSSLNNLRYYGRSICVSSNPRTCWLRRVCLPRLSKIPYAKLPTVT